MTLASSWIIDTHISHSCYLLTSRATQSVSSRSLPRFRNIFSYSLHLIFRSFPSRNKFPFLSFIAGMSVPVQHLVPAMACLSSMPPLHLLSSMTSMITILPRVCSFYHHPPPLSFIYIDVFILFTLISLHSTLAPHFVSRSVMHVS